MTQTARPAETDFARAGADGTDVPASVAAALQRAARLDPVSGLFNRRQFIEDFGFGVASGSSQQHNAVIMLTLAAPQQFNDILRALGHSFADEVVRLGANRLRRALPEGTPIYHISLLSFVFPIEASDSEAQPEILADLMQVFAEPLICNGIPVRNRVGFGLNRLAEAGSEPSEVLRGALVAAQNSRNTGQGWGWYNAKTDQAHLRSFRLLADLGRLVDGGSAEASKQFALHYQPKIDMRTGRCCGAEALMRWTHPSLGFISPAEFVPLAEATAMMTPLTRWVFRKGVADRAAWRSAGIDARISLNVSPINLAEPDFAEFILQTCRENDVSPDMIEIEFTESAQTMDSALTLAQLNRLRSEGVEVAIDDFGSGYSNMRYLRSIPADTLKIDKDFILTLDTDEANQKIVPTIIDLGHHLGFKVVAEGIESAASYDMLAGWDCDEAQGFHMSKPLPEPQFREWYTAQAEKAA